MALKYEKGSDSTPRLMAKGFGLTAERIIELARGKGIPIQEDPDLVAALAQLDFHEEIPPELYQTVAEILAFVYRLNQQMEQRPEQ